MSRYEVESGIQMPERSVSSDYPWEQLNVGQSFFIPYEDLNALKDPKGSMNAKARTVMQRTDKIFRIRDAEKDGVKGLRVFRMEGSFKEQKRKP